MARHGQQVIASLSLGMAGKRRLAKVSRRNRIRRPFLQLLKFRREEERIATNARLNYAVALANFFDTIITREPRETPPRARQSPQCRALDSDPTAPAQERHERLGRRPGSPRPQWPGCEFCVAITVSRWRRILNGRGPIGAPREAALRQDDVRVPKPHGLWKAQRPIKNPPSKTDRRSAPRLRFDHFLFRCSG
jgi:hypothetical protein